MEDVTRGTGDVRTRGEDDGALSNSVVSAPVRSRVFVLLLKALVLISRFGLAAMFLLAAGAKLFTLREFAANMSNLVPASLIWPVTLSVIAAELLAAILLVVPRTVRLGALLASALLVGFAGYALYYVYVQHGEPLECGCFGGLIASQLGVSTALRNLALLIPAALVFYGQHRIKNETTLRREAGTPDNL